MELVLSVCVSPGSEKYTPETDFCTRTHTRTHTGTQTHTLLSQVIERNNNVCCFICKDSNNISLFAGSGKTTR